MNIRRMALKKREILQIIPITGTWQAVFLVEPLREQPEPVIVAVPVVSWALIEEKEIDSGTKTVLGIHKSVVGLSNSPVDNDIPAPSDILEPSEMVSCEYFHEFLGYTNDGNIEQFKPQAMVYFKEWLGPQLVTKGKRV